VNALEFIIQYFHSILQKADIACTSLALPSSRVALGTATTLPGFITVDNPVHGRVVEEDAQVLLQQLLVST